MLNLILKWSFTVLLLHFFNVVYSYNSNPEHDYDMFLLAISWSPSNTCKNFFNDLSQTTCGSCKNDKAVNKWVIHGLWPANKNGTSPLNCRDVPFNGNLLGDNLKTQMKSIWPGSPRWVDEDFWAYEWKKHGTCAYLTEDTDTIEEYFSKTVELYNRYNIRQILDNAGIVSKNNYQTEDIHRALKNSLGVKAFVACKLNEPVQQQFLLEIHVCFDKSLSLVDCNDTSIYLDSCTRDIEVTYLESC